MPAQDAPGSTTTYARNRGKDLEIEVSLFARFAPDGRMRLAHMLTRTRP